MAYALLLAHQVITPQIIPIPACPVHLTALPAMPAAVFLVKQEWLFPTTSVSLTVLEGTS